MSEVYTIPILDRENRRIAFRRWQDCEDILENNKRLQNEPQRRSSMLHATAEIPCILIEKWISEEMDGNNNPDAYREIMSRDGIKRIVKKKLRDPEWRWLKITDKRI